MPVLDVMAYAISDQLLQKVEVFLGPEPEKRIAHIIHTGGRVRM